MMYSFESSGSRKPLHAMVIGALVGAAVLFPIVTGGGLVCSFLISAFIYKEKLSRIQIFGFALGIVAVVLLKL